MKNSFYLSVFLFTILIFPLTVSAQSEESYEFLFEKYRGLDSVRHSLLNNNLLLNKGFLIQESLLPYKEESDEVLNTPSSFSRLYRSLKRSQVGLSSIEPQYLSEESYESIIDSFREYSSVVPIGVVVTKGDLLSDANLAENITSNTIIANTQAEYEEITIRSASILKSFALTPQVTFKLPTELYHNDITEESVVRINFGDEIYHILSPGMSVEYDFGFPGEKIIHIEIVTNNNTFTSNCILSILAYEQPEADDVFELTVTKSFSNNKSSTFRGRAELFVGCDNVFDKPVIVVEGFDPLNMTPVSFTQSNLENARVESRMSREGYDMVYLDFNDGGADIRNNSEVLQQLIRDVNDRKIGNDPLIIIGISMGGLVARHAIRRLEQQNFTHNVGHFISFDSPHKGANVPVGLQTLLLDVDDILLRDIFGIGQNQIDDVLELLNSKAARQMLLRYKGPDPHPDFIEFQKILDDLGFPQQGNIRNIAIVNGSVDGERQLPLNDYEPNDKIARATFALGPILIGALNANINVRTNKINDQGTVSSILISSGLVPLTLKERKFNFDVLNYDISSGGISPVVGQPIELPWWGNTFNMAEWFGPTVQTFGRENFSFVPLFSSCASSGALNTQQDLNRSVLTLLNNGLSPFDEIYAGVENSRHISAFSIRNIWSDLMLNEFLVSPTTFGCQESVGDMGQAPTPIIDGIKFFMCEDELGLPFWDRDASLISNFFNHTWSVTGPSSLPGGVGDNYFFSGAGPGLYTISLTRTYTNPLVGQQSTSTSRVVVVEPRESSRFGCDGDTGGNPMIPQKSFQGQLQSNNKHIKTELLSIYPNPLIGNRLTVEYTLAENEEDVTWEIYEVKSGRKIYIEISNPLATQKSGKHLVNFKIDNIENGVYIVSLQTIHNTFSQKIIVVK